MLIGLTFFIACEEKKQAKYLEQAVKLDPKKTYIGKEYQTSFEVEGKIFQADRRNYDSHTPEGLIALDKVDVLVRIADVEKLSGNKFKYTIAYIPQREGTFDLRDHLLELNAYPNAKIPSIKFTSHYLLTDKEKVDTNLISEYELTKPNFGNYWTYFKLLAIAWFVGFVLCLFYRRKFSTKVKLVKKTTKTVSLADQLAELINVAIKDNLSVAQKARLEMLIVHHWRAKLNLTGQSMQESLKIIKQDKTAGELVIQIEKWIHCPANKDSVNLDKLLAPYKNEPAVSDLQLQGDA